MQEIIKQELQGLLAAQQTQQDPSSANKNLPDKAMHALVGALANKNNHMIADAVPAPSSNPPPYSQPSSSYSTNQTGGSVPSPSIPDSGCPNASWPGDQETNINGTGYLDKLNQFLLYIAYHPDDSTATMNFMAYLATLQQNGVLNTPDVQSLLNSSGILSSPNFTAMVQQAVLNSMFYGYDGQNGVAGATNFINAVDGVLNPLAGGSSIISQMQGLFQGQLNMMWSLEQTYGFANGGTGQFQIGNMIYSWDNGDDQQYIIDYINNISPSGTPNPFYKNFNPNNGFERTYRMIVFNQLLSEYKDPSIVLCLFLMMTNDQQTMAQEGGLADTVNQMDAFTNNYSTPMLTLAQNFGSLTTSQAQQFVDDLYNGTNEMNMRNAYSGLASTWNTNVYGTITEQQVTITPNVSSAAPVTTSLGNLMTGTPITITVNGQSEQYTPTITDVTNALNSLNQKPSSPTNPSTNGAYQGIVNALQQAGSLTTNPVQTLTTQIATATQNDQQYLAFGAMITSPTGGGSVQMENSIVQNQKTN